MAGTTVGAGVLALPAATVSVGFIPSTAALIVADVLMTTAGLLIAELTLNQIGRTGRPGLGLLELYQNNLGAAWGAVGCAAYFFLHYAMMVAYIAQGGANLQAFLGSDLLPGGTSQLAFATFVGASLLVAKPSWIENVNNAMVLAVGASFLGIVGIGAQSADWSALTDAANQHPEGIISCFPILFLSLVYQNVVPTVVNNLEGDRTKITQSIVMGTSFYVFSVERRMPGKRGRRRYDWYGSGGSLTKWRRGWKYLAGTPRHLVLGVGFDNKPCRIYGRLGGCLDRRFWDQPKECSVQQIQASLVRTCLFASSGVEHDRPIYILHCTGIWWCIWCQHTVSGFAAPHDLEAALSRNGFAAHYQTYGGVGQGTLGCFMGGGKHVDFATSRRKVGHLGNNPLCHVRGAAASNSSVFHWKKMQHSKPFSLRKSRPPTSECTQDTRR